MKSIRFNIFLTFPLPPQPPCSAPAAFLLFFCGLFVDVGRCF